MILERLDTLSKTIGIDLGSDFVRVWVKGQGLVVEQPSYLAVDTTSQRVLAVGEEAREMNGRVAANVKVFRPVQAGQVWDTQVAKAFLQGILKEVLSKSFFSPTLLISVPASLNSAVEAETIELGNALVAREVLTVSSPLAAAIGAGMPVADASGGFILQLGAGVSEAAVVSLGSLVGVEASKEAGDYFIQQVIVALQETQHVTVSPETASLLIQKVASLGKEAKKSQLVTGKSVKSGAPKEIEVTTDDLREVSEKMVGELVRLVQRLVTKVPTELTVDIVDKGLLLSGGGAKLTGLEEFMVPKLGVPVSVVDEPEQAVARGLGTIMENLDNFRRSLNSKE